MLHVILRNAKKARVARVAVRARIAVVIPAVVEIVTAIVTVTRQLRKNHVVSRNQWRCRSEIYPPDQMVRFLDIVCSYLGHLSG